MRCQGAKLPVDAVRASVRRLQVKVEQDKMHQYTQRATLLDPATGQQVGRLDCANIVRVDGGVMVAGHEASASSRTNAQLWWCVPVSQAATSAAVLASGFDPADDDRAG